MHRICALSWPWFTVCSSIYMHSMLCTRGEVSIVEVNKVLVKEGYKVFRKRELIPGSSNALKEWRRGRRIWRFRRWVDNRLPQDMNHLETKLTEMHRAFPETSDICIERIISAIATSEQNVKANKIQIFNKYRDRDSACTGTLHLSARSRLRRRTKLPRDL